MSVAVLTVSGAVLADVVLTYFASTNTGAGTTPFGFENAGNYNLASHYNLVVNTFTTASAHEAVLATLGLVQDVQIEAVNVTSFNLTNALALHEHAYIKSPGTFGSVSAGVNGIVCAYAIVTTYFPSGNVTSLGGVSTSGANCGAFIPGPALGVNGATATGQGCIGGKNYAVFNLTSGVEDSESGMAAGATLCSLSSFSTVSPGETGSLFVTYSFTSDLVVTSGTVLDGFSVPVTMTQGS
ncbi:MAG: hypothetical protein KGJ23_00455 [Euryarchaeota archaeon]|nr:hypothetical protein [Euryarchaeota archaeon]MDE1835067.1 hypothetical protein [Euryarchaeota archaeon]MDE1879338.1 hypothetical protein [Euryarchaeota archaeon]MDE2044971.1 hypothetical protein [Thermoplasmata archaeon]